AQATHAEELKLNHNNETFSQRWQRGSADPGLPQTSVVTLAPKGTSTLILTQQFKGDCQDLYLEHVSENPLNELGDAAMQEMDYVIEHPQRTAKPQLDVSIAAFPNPTSDFVTVEATGLTAGTYTVRITDANGRLVQKQTIDRPLSGVEGSGVEGSGVEGSGVEVTLDLRNEAAGVYIIDMINEDNPVEAKAIRVMKD
ncbi:MAG: T9SS type A sorting domain-containing protein, partial [Bacteroidia bacterium]